MCSVNFAPEQTGIGKYSGDMAGWLVRQGHQVRVISAPPYYLMWKIAPGYLKPWFRRESWRGVDVWRGPLWVPKTPGGLARALHLLPFAVTSFPLMLRQLAWRPDLVLNVVPTFVCAPAALLTARLSGAKSWLHLLDFEVDAAFQLGLLKGQLLRRAVLRIERWLMRRFDRVSTISRRAVELVVKKDLPVEKALYFPNWVVFGSGESAAPGRAANAIA